MKAYFAKAIVQRPTAPAPNPGRMERRPVSLTRLTRALSNTEPQLARREIAIRSLREGIVPTHAPISLTTLARTRRALRRGMGAVEHGQ